VAFVVCTTFGISSDVDSHRHNAQKIEEGPPYDFQVSLACSKFPILFHWHGPDVNAKENYHWTSHWEHDSQLVK